MATVKALATTVDVLARTAVQIVRSFAPGASVDALKMEWAQDMLAKVKIELSITGLPKSGPGVLFIGNHVSYLDIPLLLAAIPGVSFVAKKEIRAWPLFGYGANRMDTVFVDRQNSQNRTEARETIGLELERGKRIVLFPSGTTTLDETAQWRRGAFEIARTHAMHAQPFRISYQPLRTAAFIGEDALLPHLFNVLSKGQIKARLEFREPIVITDPDQSLQDVQLWTQQALA